jgi:hypothetical protein
MWMDVPTLTVHKTAAFNAKIQEESDEKYVLRSVSDVLPYTRCASNES